MTDYSEALLQRNYLNCYKHDIQYRCLTFPLLYCISLMLLMQTYGDTPELISILFVSLNNFIVMVTTKGLKKDSLCDFLKNKVLLRNSSTYYLHIDIHGRSLGSFIITLSIFQCLGTLHLDLPAVFFSFDDMVGSQSLDAFADLLNRNILITFFTLKLVTPLVGHVELGTLFWNTQEVKISCLILQALAYPQHPY